MNSFTSFTSSSSLGASRQFPTSTFPVPNIEAADSSTGSGLKRVRTVSGKVGQDMILERRKARAVVKVAKPSVASSVLELLKKIASLTSPTDITTTTTLSEPTPPSTPKRPTRLSSPPPLEYKRTRVLDTTVSIEPIRLFYGPLFEGDKKARVRVLEISDDAVSYVPKLWAAAVRHC